ncbi:cupredoxin domain-containing protein [Archangium lipolyticum]|uniref:cupredoxin n=1 Tax=Archangium lipolyticum TaxID=2970465 RepID=UPI00214A0D47|nr:cupredoxin [Archangium lipolyticum]
MREAWRQRLALAVLLTLGMLGWELCLLELLSGGFDVPASALAPRLARDAMLLFPLWLVALWRTRPEKPRDGAALSLCFLLLLLPVAAGRAVLQRQQASPPPSEAMEGQALSATEPALGDEGRFLCATVGADVSAISPEPASDSPMATAWTGMRDALLLQVPVLPLTLLLLRRRSRPTASEARAATPALGPLLLLGILCGWRSDGGPPSPRLSSLQQGEGVCRPGAPVRTYSVAAIAVDRPLNAHGDHQPQGLMYVLEEERTAPGLHGEPIQPLVLRANLGECLLLHFTNRLATGPAALRIEGLPATVSGRSPEGGFVPGTSVPPGRGLTYVLALPESPEAEGTYLLHDSEEGGAREARGLFGVLVLEPAGARYRDASTGEPLRHGTGWEALIDVPSGEHFRELVLLYHALGPPESADVRSASGAPLPVLDEMAGPFRAGAFGVNYRSEPRFDREEHLPEDGERRPSPRRRLATPALRSYLGEPVKLRLAHAGSAEFHVHHVHDGNERRGGGEPPQLLSPGRGRTLLLGQPGGFPQAPGRFLVHCHVPNHFTGGEWLEWHVFSAPQRGLAPLPSPNHR